jgi:pyrroloquinoline quinone biosynthesis protein E
MVKKTDKQNSTPYGLLAELTHRCPLRCAYCSNPVELLKPSRELQTEEWLKVLQQAHELGVVQLHLSGGEPLVRLDLETIVERATALSMYTNLITSGVDFTAKRARSLVDVGLASVQLSLQAADALLSGRIAGTDSFARKVEAAAIITEAGLPLSMNVVVHRLNLHQLEEIIDLCHAWGARRLELANTQFYGWAMLNRDTLLPSPEQLAAAETIYLQKKQLLEGKMEIIWVLSDYHEKSPKPCMGGWGSLQLTIAPDGTVMPCPAAGVITSLRFENVRQKDLSWIWHESESFNKFRGFDWMKEPCNSCDKRFEDFGGCRCQALMLTGDATNADPVCELSPQHRVVAEAVERSKAAERSEAVERSKAVERSEAAGKSSFKYRQFL